MDTTKQTGTHAPDVLIANEGTVLLFDPITSRAKEWIDENVQPEAQWFGATLVVETSLRLGPGAGMLDAGLYWSEREGGHSGHGRRKPT